MLCAIKTAVDCFIKLSRYRDDYLETSSRTGRRDTSFASPKESIQRKGDSMPLASCASRIYRELSKGTSLSL